MTTTTILALDLGTTTGWALRAPEGQIDHGFVSFKSQRFEGGGMRYLRFRRRLTEVKATVAGTQGLGAVYFEEVRWPHRRGRCARLRRPLGHAHRLVRAPPDPVPGCAGGYDQEVCDWSWQRQQGRDDCGNEGAWSFTC